ncbi:MAG: mechanosensitive ion channel family protein [Leucobacter sp.]
MREAEVEAVLGVVRPAFSIAFTDFLTTYQVPLRILAIVVAAVLLNWILRLMLMRAVHRIVRGVKKSQNVDSTAAIQTTPYIQARSVQRTRTLGTVGRHVITWVLSIGAAILILGNLGVNLAALLTSAGIIAAGLAFGAQNIVKDILNGIFMVFEDQLGVGDLVTIGDITGTVEDVGIRVTQVRADDGTLWFIRNGEILMLGSSSQGWGRAILDVTVDANEDLARVTEVLLAAARAVMDEPAYAAKVTGQPQVRGLESVYGDRATLRLVMQTHPEAKAEVRRGLRAEIRREFIANGIRLADEPSA